MPRKKSDGLSPDRSSIKEIGTCCGLNPQHRRLYGILIFCERCIKYSMRCDTERYVFDESKISDLKDREDCTIVLSPIENIIFESIMVLLQRFLSYRDIQTCTRTRIHIRGIWHIWDLNNFSIFSVLSRVKEQNSNRWDCAFSVRLP